MQNSKEHEKTFILAQRKTQSLFFGGSKRVSAFNPGMIDLLLRSDLARMENVIVDSTFDIFMEPGDNLKYPFLARSLSEISALYYLKDAAQAIELLRKRKKIIPQTTFFNDSADVVLHRKYNDDSTGLNWRIADAAGTEHHAIAPKFSVQLLFFTVPQLFPNATLTGNLLPGNLKGFTVFNAFDSRKLYFGVNGSFTEIQVLYQKWYYCVMNVFDDHFDVYKNGVFAETKQLSEPMIDHGTKLYVGNLGNFEYYIGPIAEVSIANKTVDSTQISATWQQIRQATNQ